MGSTIVWTALPAGVRRVNGAWLARVSVVVSPRLETAAAAGASLADFPVFLDWPKTVKEASFTLRWSDGIRIVGETTVRPASPDAPDGGAWRALFDERTPVRPFDAPEGSSRGPRMLSYDSRDVVREVRDLYARTLRLELGLGTAPTVPGRFAGKSVPEDALSLEELLARWGRATSPLERFALYHCRVESTGAARRSGASEDPREFHRMVGALGTHPGLLRQLGLVLDFTVPAADLGLDGSLAEEPRLGVVPNGTGVLEAAPVCPWTAVEHDPHSRGAYRTFTVAHEGWVARRGFLWLGDDRVSVVQEQHEHTTLSLMQHQDTVAATGETTALPALLQGGMRLTHGGAPASLGQAIQDQARLESRLRVQKARTTPRDAVWGERPDDTPLFAEQLTRGYRIDVRDADRGPWRSLCRRRVRYETEGWSWPSSSERLEEEGAIEPSARTDQDGEVRVLRPADDLFEWDGWSLVVPRPGQAVDGVPSEPEPGLPLTVEAEVPPGSLQRQRFGRRYRFRARLVDLAGNSLAVDEADAVAPERGAGRVATPPVRCARVESAKPPVLVPAQPRGPGEAGDVIVLRDAESHRHRTSEVRFHVLPPSVPLRLAERHGIFDGMTPQESWALIQDHRGELPEEDGAREIDTPYLPDPMVRQAVLLLPGGAEPVEMPAFDDLPWRFGRRELARSCGLVVCRGRDGVRARVRGRKVVVEVPRGRVQKIRVAARLTPDDIERLAQPEWLTKADPALNAPSRTAGAREALSRLSERAARGGAPLLAPSREISIIYATQRPLAEPRFGRARILQRAPDSTVAVMADEEFRFDAPSTGRLDVYAQWEDPLDNAKEDGWREAGSEILAIGVGVSEEGRNPLALQTAEAVSSLSHDFGDTKHHEVRYRAVATSRFVDFYPRSLTGDPGNTTRTSGPVVLHVPATAPPAPPEVAYVVPTFRQVDSPAERSDVGRPYHAVRMGDGLRVFMSRGWFSSGKGERLALVLATPSTPGEQREGLSTWAENPLRDSAPLPGPLELDHIRGGWGRIDGWSLDGGSVGLSIHDVQFSEEHRLPFADVEFRPQPAFMPLVRLALARYQEHAIEGCGLSRIVHADFVPLTPGRSLTVRKTEANTWSLVLGGFSYGTDGPGTSVVRAHLELMSRATPEEIAAWRPLGEAVTLVPVTGTPYHFQWSGQVRVDEPRFLTNDWRRRLVVRELEPFDTDDEGDGPLEQRARLISAHTVPI